MYLKKFVHQVGHWLRLYKDARSTKHTKKMYLFQSHIMTKILWVETEGRNVELRKSVQLGYYINRHFVNWRFTG